MAVNDSLRPLRRYFAGTSLLRVATVLALVPVAVGAAVVGALVARSGDSGKATIPEASRGRPLERTSFLAKLIPLAPGAARVRGPSVPRSVADLIRRLPLERKVAQLFLFGFKGQDLNALIYQRLRRLDLGGIVIDSPNYTGAQLLGQMAGEALVISRQQRHVPPWVMAQQEGGEFNAFPDLPPADRPSSSARRPGRRPKRARRARPCERSASPGCWPR
jgi:hypothetical protein